MIDPVEHDVTLEPGCALEGLYTAGELRIASWHHQAVDRLGEGLRAVAWAPDGVIEAVELAGAPFLLAVQWHPELQQQPGSPQRLPFAEVVRQGAARVR